VDGEARLRLFESAVKSREEAVSSRERETENMQKQLQGLIQNFDSNTREVREGLVEERGRLGREHIRLEALTGALQVERHTLKEQVEVEQRRLEELREVRSRERELFLAECLEERKTLSHERTELSRQKERASSAVVSAEKRAAEMDARVALETAQHEVQQRYAKELREALEKESLDTAAGREALEQERDAFEQEASRFTALGMQTQQRSEEAARTKEAAVQERLAAEAQQQETKTLTRQLEVRQKALEEQHVRLSADRRALEDERSGMSEERAALGEDRLRASRAAETVRAMQLRLSGHLSSGGSGGVSSFSDSDLHGGQGGFLGVGTSGAAGSGGGFRAGAGGTMEMLRKVLQEARADVGLSGHKSGRTRLPSTLSPKT
jgi:hypothetical protein